VISKRPAGDCALARSDIVIVEQKAGNLLFSGSASDDLRYIQSTSLLGKGDGIVRDARLRRAS